MAMINIYVIGCGGIGGYLIERLPMVISSLSLDVAEDAGLDIGKYLSGAGNVSLPCIVDRIVLIDGDVFNPRNALRQGAGAGSKLVQRMRGLMRELEALKSAAEELQDAMQLEAELAGLRARMAAMRPERLDADARILQDEGHLTDRDCERLSAEMIRVSFLQRMKLTGWNTYVTPDSIARVIPETPEPNLENTEAADVFSSNPRLMQSCAVVFLCVDNVQTRYEVSRYMERFRDCIVINGGNSKTTGHATVYERSRGAALDPPLYEVYPDIRPGVDKRPDEEECTLIAPKHDQIAVTNSLVADVMLARFVKWVRTGLDVEVRGRTVRYNDILIDTEKPSMTPVFHPVSQK